MTATDEKWRSGVPGPKPTTAAAYDAIADDYAAFVEAALADPASVLRLATDAVLARLGDVRRLTICDLGCGEGHLTRRLAAQGATVVGVDTAGRLLARAVARAGDAPTTVGFVRDDGQRLAAFGDERFDAVVANLALMDIPDLPSLYAAARRVLRPGGRFVGSITHPCFQGPGADIETDGTGAIVARRIPRYATEGFWRSDDPGGIRGRVGAHHRTLSTYVNRLLAAGFAIVGIDEPTPKLTSDGGPLGQCRVEFPPVLVIDARRI